MTTIFIPKWMYVICADQNINMHRNSLKLGVTHAHICKINKDMQEKGLIRIEREGRVNKIELTTKGLRTRDACFKLMSALN